MKPKGDIGETRSLARHVASKLAAKLHNLDARSQIAAVHAWRSALDEIHEAFRKARRLRAERARVAAHEGWTPRLSLPGVSGRIHDIVWDYIIEGAVAGARREMTENDAPMLADAYRLTENAVFASVRAARAEARGDEARRLLLRRAAVVNAPSVAVAIGYGTMRPMSFDLVYVEAVGKRKPALDIAVLALVELGHTGESIARELDIDSATVRRARHA